MDFISVDMVRGSAGNPLSEPDLVDHCKVGPSGVKLSGYRKFGLLIITSFGYLFFGQKLEHWQE